jgi:hypothetical protein
MVVGGRSVLARTAVTEALGLSVELYDPRALEDFAATLKIRPPLSWSSVPMVQ